MNIKRLTLAVLTSGVLGLSAFPVPLGHAQSRQWCESDGEFEPASETERTVELPDFGIQVDIPSNYRTMKRQDGSVEILHPDDFEFIQCLVGGGIGAHGYYSESIELAARDPSMSLTEQAIWTVGYGFDANGDRVPIAAEVIDYRQPHLNGYVVTSEIGYSAVFLGSVPGRNQLLRISAGCDCPVEVEALTDLLSRIQPLN